MPLSKSRRPLQGGFSLIELMVVVAVIAIIAAIAMPNFQRAMRDTRRKSAHRAAIMLSHAIDMHASTQDAPPSSADMNLVTLQPLVESGSMTEGEIRSNLARFEGEQLDLYYTFNGSFYNMGSETAFIFYFRPEGEPDAWCYAWSRWGNCWYGDGTWEQFTGHW